MSAYGPASVRLIGDVIVLLCENIFFSLEYLHFRVFLCKCEAAGYTLTAVSLQQHELLF